MNATAHIVCLSGALLAALAAQAQGGFQNLDFESANLADPFGIYNEVPIGNGLPWWSGSIGPVAATEVWADGVSAGTATLDVEGPNVNSAGIGPLDGNYSAFLQSGATPGGSSVGVDVSIFQSGMIPSDALSLQFDVWSLYPEANFSVSFAGNSLSPVVLSTVLSASGENYDVYGVSIASYAGQTGQLDFTALFNDGINPGNIELDDITFSPMSVPEPNMFWLTAFGGLLLAAGKWFPKR
jgi:hypothetical protein